jgi:hypothetical protein
MAKTSSHKQNPAVKHLEALVSVGKWKYQILLGGGQEGLGGRLRLLGVEVRPDRLHRSPRRRREGARHKGDRALPGSDGHQPGGLLAR